MLSTLPAFSTLLTHFRFILLLANSALLLTLAHRAFLQYTQKAMANVPFHTLHLFSGIFFSKAIRNSEFALSFKSASWSRDSEFESRQEQQKNFVLQSQLCVLALIRCPFHPSVITVARKRPRTFCQKCRWQDTLKHAYTLDPSKSEWADCAAIQAECGNL